jgi:hypothetical protein
VLGRIGEGKEGTGKAQATKRGKTKQMPKATSEEENKSQQTLG